MSMRILRDSLRPLTRRTGFSSLAVLILAVGIAFATMVVSLAHSIYAGAVPYADPDRIVVVWRRGPEPMHQREATSYPNIRDWAQGGASLFEGLAAYTIATSSIRRSGGAERVMVSYVDPYFFDALDVDMALRRHADRSAGLASIAPAIIFIALAAAFVPVRRALAVGPAEALRHE